MNIIIVLFLKKSNFFFGSIKTKRIHFIFFFLYCKKNHSLKKQYKYTLLKQEKRHPRLYYFFIFLDKQFELRDENKKSVKIIFFENLKMICEKVIKKKRKSFFLTLSC